MSVDDLVGTSESTTNLTSLTSDTHIHTTSTTKKPKEVPSFQYPTAMHSLSGFIDVGEVRTGLFAPENLEYREYLADKMILEKKLKLQDVKQEDLMKVEEDTSNHPHQV